MSWGLMGTNILTMASKKLGKVSYPLETLKTL